MRRPEAWRPEPDHLKIRSASVQPRCEMLDHGRSSRFPPLPAAIGLDGTIYPSTARHLHPGDAPFSRRWVASLPELDHPPAQIASQQSIPYGTCPVGAHGRWRLRHAGDFSGVGDPDGRLHRAPQIQGGHSSGAFFTSTTKSSRAALSASICSLWPSWWRPSFCWAFCHSCSSQSTWWARPSIYTPCEEFRGSTVNGRGRASA